MESSLLNHRWIAPVLLLSILLSGCFQSLPKTTISDAPTTAPSDQAALSEGLNRESATPPENNPETESEGADSGGIENGHVTGESGSPAANAAPPTTKKVQTFLDEALDYLQVAQDFWENGELDNALEALDQAYLLILKVETYEDAKLIQQKEDLRFMISKRILEIYASRNIVVNGDHDEIPLEINRHVQAEIDRFTKGSEKRFFIESYKRSGHYRAYISEELRKAGLPEELSWLPLIESGYKVNALSRARALGLWQFIPSTGYKFGLKRDMYIDERLDPEKSTAAAIAYLKELHQIFGDWTTVLAAYNCGEGRVLRIIRTQNINYLDNFWDLYERLPLETARYVPRFLATLYIIRNAEENGLSAVEPAAPYKFEVVDVERRMSLKNTAQAIGTDVSELKALNPELRYGVLPPTKYSLRVPPGKEEPLLASLDQIPLSSPPQRAFVYHRVRPGETLSGIADRYNTSARSIQVANNIRRRNFIVAGQKLKIPQRGMKVYPVSPPPPKEAREPKVHTVKSGDSLWNLARRYGTTVKTIQELNHLSGPDLVIGQRLKIPGYEPKPATPTGQKTYTVRRGDSPYTIANRHDISLKKFLEMNQLTPRSRIYPGQKLFVE